MSEATEVDVVKRCYAAFGRGDIPGLLALIDPGCDWISPGPPDLPTAGSRKGPEAVAGLFQTLGQMYEFLRFEPTDFIAQGDRVAVLGSSSVRVRRTGATIELAWAHVFTVRDGRITRFEEYLDLSQAVEEHRRAAAAR